MKTTKSTLGVLALMALLAAGHVNAGVNLDKTGDRINDQLDVLSDRAANHGRDRLARNLDRKGDRIDRRLDHRDRHQSRPGRHRVAHRVHYAAHH